MEAPRPIGNDPRVAGPHDLTNAIGVKGLSFPGQHYTTIEQVPCDIQKYYNQRYSIFSKYDEGVRMTDNAWYEVTPEPVAIKIAQHVSELASAGKTVLIDCFAGVGGNAIAFAASGRWARIVAIEKDPEVLACAKLNAEIYGVHERICWYQGDCFQHLPLLSYSRVEAVLFASPPWGGPGYNDDNIFDLSTMRPYSIADMVDCFSEIASDIILYLPRNSDLSQIAGTTLRNHKTVVVHYCMEGASKAICAFYGTSVVKVMTCNRLT